MKIVFTKFKVKVTVLTNFHFKYPVSEVDNDDNVRSSAGWQCDPNKSLNESKQRLIRRLPLIKDNKHWEEKTAGGDLYLNRSPRNLSKHRTTICVRESGQSANKKIPVLVNFELLFTTYLLTSKSSHLPLFTPIFCFDLSLCSAL